MDNRIGTFDALPALTVSGKPREPACPLSGIGDGYVVARDLFPLANEDAVIDEIAHLLEQGDPAEE